MYLRYEGLRDAVIYGLVDPRSEEIRYIGKTVTSPKARLRRHIVDKGNSHKHRWINQLLSLDLEPEILVLDAGNWACDELNAVEIKWIAKGCNSGWNLTNVTPGGDGGYNDGLKRHNESEWTSERRQRHSELMKEWANQHKARGGNFQGGPESVAKRVASRLANPDYRRKISEGQKKRYEDPTERAKTSEAVREGHAKSGKMDEVRKSPEFLEALSAGCKRAWTAERKETVKESTLQRNPPRACVICDTVKVMRTGQRACSQKCRGTLLWQTRRERSA